MHDRPTPEPDANGYVLPYAAAIDEALTNGLYGDKVAHDVDIAGGDAHYFWTIHCLDRPNTQLFVCVSWHASDTDPRVLLTVDCRYTDDQEPITGLGALTAVSIAPRIAARIVLDAVDSFNRHGHI